MSWKRWAIRCGLIGGLIILGAWLFREITNMAPIEIPDYQGQRDSIAAAYRRDAAFWHRRHIADSTRADSGWKLAGQFQRRSIASRPARTPRMGTIPPDSGMDNNAGVIPDSVSVITQLQAAYDSLWTALDLADSAYSNLAQAYSEQVQATASAMAGWRSADSALSAERLIADRAIKDLTGRLRKAERGSRLLGFLPMPELVCGYGVTLAAGAVQHGPSCTAGIKVRF